MKNCRVTIPNDRPIAGYPYPEIATKKKPYFMNISSKTKIFWGVTLGLGPIGTIDSRKKTRAQKSHASVPLRSMMSE